LFDSGKKPKCISARLAPQGEPLLRWLQLALSITLQLVVLAGGLLVTPIFMAQFPMWATLAASGLITLLACASIAFEVSVVARPAEPQTREPNPILRWMMIGATLVVAMFVIAGGLLVQLSVLGGAMRFSPTFAILLNLIAAASWLVPIARSTIREIGRQLGQDAPGRTT
jgi:hypothetical protein